MRERPPSFVLAVAATLAVLAVLYGTASRRSRAEAPVPAPTATSTTAPAPSTTTRPPTPFEQPAELGRGVAGDGLDAVCALLGC